MHKKNIFDLFNEQNKPTPEPVTPSDIVTATEHTEKADIVKPDNPDAATVAPTTPDAVEPADVVDDSTHESEVIKNVE